MEKQALQSKNVVTAPVNSNSDHGTEGITVLFQNVQSLLSKLDEISIILEEQNPDVIGLTETWLDGSHGEGDFSFSTYSTEFKLRSKKPNRGGVLIYIHKRLKYTVLCPPRHHNNCKCENLWVRIHGGKASERDLIIGITYRSHQNIGTIFVEHFKADLEYIVAFQQPTIILGDFNFDLNTKSSIVTSYKDSLEGFFFAQLVTEPTRITENSSTIIDHLWTNEEEIIINYAVETGLSDHKMIKATCDLKIQHVKRPKFHMPFLQGTQLGKL